MYFLQLLVALCLVILVHAILSIIMGNQPTENTETIQKPQDVSPENYITQPKAPSYKKSIIIFSSGLFCLGISYAWLYNLRSSIGHSGSEAEIAIYPLGLLAYLLIVISIVMFLLTVVKRIRFDLKYRPKDNLKNQ